MLTNYIMICKTYRILIFASSRYGNIQNYRFKIFSLKKDKRWQNLSENIKFRTKYDNTHVQNKQSLISGNMETMSNTNCMTLNRTTEIWYPEEIHDGVQVTRYCHKQNYWILITGTWVWCQAHDQVCMTIYRTTVFWKKLNYRFLIKKCMP